MTGSVEAAVSGQQQQQQLRWRGVQVSRRVVMVGGLMMVAVVATAAILAVTLSGSTTPPAAAPESHKAPLQQPPVGFVPQGEAGDLLHQVALHARQVEVEREMRDRKRQQQHNIQQEEEIQKPAEHDKGHQEKKRDKEVDVDKLDVQKTENIKSKESENTEESLKESEKLKKVKKMDQQEMQETEDKDPKESERGERMEDLKDTDNSETKDSKEPEEEKDDMLKEKDNPREIEEKLTEKQKKQMVRNNKTKEPQKKDKMDEPQKEKDKKTGVAKAEAKNVNGSPRLPTRQLSNGFEICDTPECAEVAAQLIGNVDYSAHPCQDFYQFACGGWINKHELSPEGDAGTWYEALEAMDNRLHVILERPANPGAPQPLHMLRSFYRSCTDTDNLDALGLDPLVTLLSSAQGGWPMVLDGWDPNTFTLTTALTNLRNIRAVSLFTVILDADVTDVSTKIINVLMGDVPWGVPQMANPTPNLRNAYTEFMTSAARMLRDHLASSVTDLQIDQQVKAVIDFEIKYSQLAERALDEADSGWRTDVAGLQTETDAGTPGQFDWLAYLKELFINTDVIITTEEPILSIKNNFFRDVSNLLAETDSRTLANALGWWWVFRLRDETTYAMRNASHNFLFAVHDEHEPEPRWVTCQNYVSTYNTLGYALSREYVDEFLPEVAKPEAMEMVEDLREAYYLLLDNNTWMLPQDLVEAKEKLDAIEAFVAYPEWIMDDAELTLAYEGLTLVNGEHLFNLKKMGVWFFHNRFATFRDPPEKSFIFSPISVNSFYYPQQNSVTITAGILQLPFYAHNSLAAVNYGALGMIIGHEMTHGFDTSGRLFDKDGNMVQWWSNETINTYNERAECFVNQYSQYHLPEFDQFNITLSVDGQQTLRENIADNGGIREAFRAYQLYVHNHGEEPRLPGLEEFSPDHLFYLAFANLWCESNSLETALDKLSWETHAPSRFRVLGSLSNDAEFSRVWKCPAGSPMNRGDDRCLLW